MPLAILLSLSLRTAALQIAAFISFRFFLNFLLSIYFILKRETIFCIFFSFIVLLNITTVRINIFSRSLLFVHMWSSTSSVGSKPLAKNIRTPPSHQHRYDMGRVCLKHWWNKGKTIPPGFSRHKIHPKCSHRKISWYFQKIGLVLPW